MQRLRGSILELGGIQAANSYVKINLSLFGLYPRAFVPTVPPELVLLPGGSLYMGGVLYEMASWTRAIVVPLSIVQSVGGVRPAPDGYIVVIGTWNTHVANGALYPLPYDVLADFAPISLLVNVPYLIVAGNAVPAHDLQGFIAWLI